ncbi:MAG: BMP family ABC transporter substrate-binding protein [Lachnospiraceae bacterium]|nr:BMP family ABC transporter substrate-binding protein [Lachnospiraceae bacterium]
MKKKLLGALMAAVLCVTAAGCGKDAPAANQGGETESVQRESVSDKKIGMILVGDENEGYTYAHIEGMRIAEVQNGLNDSNIIWKYSVPEDESCKEAAVDLVEQGCVAVFSNSYGHQTFMEEAAAEYPDVQFVSMTGDRAELSGLSNFSNAFTNVYESRFVSGVVAGMKVKELVEQGKLADENKDGGKVKIGYVGAYPYAEVVSGYTAFFLGIQYIYPDVTMEVRYTNSWFDITAEAEAANALMADGCVIIGQHADSTGAPTAVQDALSKGKPVYSVGYNVDMLSVAPEAALTSATNVWSVYYNEAVKTILEGGKIPTNWAKGYADGAVAITALGPSVAEGTQNKVDEVINGIKSGNIKVFDTSRFTVDGKHLDSYHVDMNGNFANTDPEDKEAIWDGYFHESELRSAPSFDIRIDGITELTAE